MKIASLMIDELRPELEDRGIKLKVDDGVLKAVCDKANGGKYAARDLRHTIRREIEDPIAAAITESDEGAIAGFEVTAENGEITVTKE